MQKGFWGKLEKPFFVLAPMADVTDAPYRRVIAKYGKPDVIFNEFVSADGLILADEKGKDKLLKDLIYTEEERPIVAQFFTGKPEIMEEASRLAARLGFDGIDINMGCPDRSILKQGAGAALMKDYKCASKIIEAAKNGAGDLPVSVKTRIGFNKDELEEWVSHLLTCDIVALSIHARTRKELSRVSAQWDAVERAVNLRDKIGVDTLIIGNGDVRNIDEAKAYADKYSCDGVMLGRAIFGNPWCFNTEKSIENVQIKERLSVLLEHTKLFDELFPHKNFAIMKKHYKAYLSGLPACAGRDDSKELKVQLMECSDFSEVEETIQLFLKK